MACGTPVATSDVGALREVVADAGLTFDPRDPDSIAQAIRRVTTDESLRARLGESGLRRAAGFTWETTAKRHVAAYSRVLSQA
jgi:glycosyltransferase involved in cell wall biosynthesis